MKTNKLLIVITILAAAGLGLSQQGGKTKGYRLTHISFGNVVFSKGAFRAQFNLKPLSYGCVQATREMKKFGNKDCVLNDKAEYKLIDVTKKGGKYYLLIINEAPSGNLACDACRRCGADGATGLIWIEVGPGRKVGKKQSIALSDCNTNAEIINKNGDYFESGIDFAGDVAEFRTKQSVYTNDEYLDEVTDWRYDRRSPELGIVAVKREKSK